MTDFNREMQRALLADAQKLRDMGVDCPDPIFLGDDDEPPCVECGGWHVRRICARCGEIECQNCRCESEVEDDHDDVY